MTPRRKKRFSMRKGERLFVQAGGRFCDFAVRQGKALSGKKGDKRRGGDVGGTDKSE